MFGFITTLSNKVNRLSHAANPGTRITWENITTGATKIVHNTTMQSAKRFHSYAE